MENAIQESPAVMAPFLQAGLATQAWGRGLDVVAVGSLEWVWWARPGASSFGMTTRVMAESG